MGWNADGNVHPRRIGHRTEHRRVTGVRVHPEEVGGALIARLHRHQRIPGAPVHPDHVLESLPVPPDLARTSGQVDDQQPHIGIGLADRRVANHRRRPFRLGSVRHVPGGDLTLVDARHDQSATVRRPPVAGVAVHRHPRRELGASTRVRFAVRLADDPLIGPVGIDHVQCAVTHIGDDPPGGVEAGIGGVGHG
jgi:hypothetical protein